MINYKIVNGKAVLTEEFANSLKEYVSTYKYIKQDIEYNTVAGILEARDILKEIYTEKDLETIEVLGIDDELYLEITVPKTPEEFERDLQKKIKTYTNNCQVNWDAIQKIEVTND